MALTKRGIIHRHEDDFESILYLTIDEKGYALDITLECAALVRLQSKAPRRTSWHCIGLGCVRRWETLKAAQPSIVHVLSSLMIIRKGAVLAVSLVAYSTTYRSSLFLYPARGRR